MMGFILRYNAKQVIERNRKAMGVKGDVDERRVHLHKAKSEDLLQF